MIFCAIFLVLLLFPFNDAAKILVYNPRNKYIYSHIRFAAKLSDILQENGHEVIVYQPDYDGFIMHNPAKATPYTRSNNQSVEYNVETEKAFLKHQWEEPADDLQITARTMVFVEGIFVDACKRQFEDTEALEYLKQQNFDLGIAESFDNCGFGILHAIGLKKVVAVFTMPFPDSLPSKLGLTRGESFVPSLIGGEDVEMGILGRLRNLYRLWHMDSMNIYGLGCGVEKVIQEKVDPKYTSANAIAQSSFIFINSEEHLDFPRPITPKVVYIGGFNLDVQYKESKELNALVDDAKDGFIFISFGSVAQSSSMPSQMKQEFLKTFSRFPNIKFLWKYENETDNIADGFPNVITKPWFNQPAIFDHPKLLTFITHGGMNSLVELSYKGIPAISIPLFADQFRNANLLRYRKTGLMITKDKITADNLSKLITQMITDKSFKENAKRLSRIMNSKPFSAKERFLRYIEFAAKTENFDNFDMHGRHLNLIQFYNLDIYGILVVALGTVAFIVFKFCLRLYSYFLGSLPIKTKKY